MIAGLAILSVGVIVDGGTGIGILVAIGGAILFWIGVALWFLKISPKPHKGPGSGKL